MAGNRQVHFGIRTPKALRDLIEVAADQQGISASEWSRRVLKREAARELTRERGSERRQELVGS